MADSAVREALRALRRLLIGRDYRPSPTRAMPAFWQRWRSAVIPLVLFAVVGMSFAAGQYLLDNRNIAYALSLLMAFFTTLPVLLSYHRPLVAWRFGFVGLFIGVINVNPDESWPWNPVQIFAFLLTLGAVALFAETAVVAWAGLLTLAPVFLFVDRANGFGVAALFLAVLVVGDQIRRRRTTQRALQEQAELSELEKARRAVLEERTRIAREMHDVVAHHMSMIAVQAETAPFRLPGMPAPARAEFVAIAASAREALADMRRLLGVLRSDNDAAPTAPQPGLGDVPELVAAARRAGVAVDLTADPALPTVDGPAGLAAYRIVQEALANAARHAPGAPVAVTVARERRAVRVEVVNGAPAPAPAAPAAATVPATVPAVGTVAGAGLGIAGMRERAALLGGTLTAGPTGDGGFAVTATLPDRKEPT
jgi:signal transduction histidine kinase